MDLEKNYKLACGEIVNPRTSELAVSRLCNKLVRQCKEYYSTSVNTLIVIELVT